MNLYIHDIKASAKDDTGRVGVVIDNGCLFRGGKEQAIRSRMLQSGSSTGSVR
jgi:type I restriction enzyme M protein